VSTFEKDGMAVAFSLDDAAFAVPLASVLRVIRAVSVTPLPAVPETVLGSINLQGRLIPVVDLRRKFRLPTRSVRAEDRFIVAGTPLRTLAFPVDAVTGVQEVTEADAGGRLPALTDALKGVVKMGGNLVLICDLDALLSLEEEASLNRALPSGPR